MPQNKTGYPEPATSPRLAFGLKANVRLAGSGGGPATSAGIEIGFRGDASHRNPSRCIRSPVSWGFSFSATPTQPLVTHCKVCAGASKFYRRAAETHSWQVYG